MTQSNGKTSGPDTARMALEELLRRAELHRATGPAYLRIDFNQGGVTTVRIGAMSEEIIRAPS